MFAAGVVNLRVELIGPGVTGTSPGVTGTSPGAPPAARVTGVAPAPAPGGSTCWLVVDWVSESITDK